MLCGFVSGENAQRVELMSSSELCALAADLLGSVVEFAS
jgi:hypothetical protein